MLTYWVFRAGSWLAVRLPLRLSYAAATLAARLAYYFASRPRSVAAGNLRHVMGPDASEQRLDTAVKGVFVNTVKNIVDMLRLPSFTHADIERMVTVKGWEHVEAARLSGHGIVFATAHFGALEVAMQVVPSRGLSPIVLQERLQPRRLFEYVVALRSRLGISFVAADETTVLKQTLRALRQNGIVGVAADRDVTASGRRVTFFDSPARLPDGHVSLALRTGATLLLALSLRRTDTAYELNIEPPVELARTGDREQDIEAGMASVIAILERHISANPEQWVYFQPIWLSDFPAT